MLHLTSDHLGTICMLLAATQQRNSLWPADRCMQFLHALAARTVQSRQVFASIKLKNEDAIKKSENLPYLLSAIHQHYAWPV
jgi:hypothetical protein